MIDGQPVSSCVHGGFYYLISTHTVVFSKKKPYRPSKPIGLVASITTSPVLSKTEPGASINEGLTSCTFGLFGRPNPVI